VGTLVTFKYAFGTTLKADDVRVALTTANAVTSSYTTAEANLQCSYYDAAGALSKVACTAANFTACAEPGGCQVHVLVQLFSIKLATWGKRTTSAGT
jgi:hypothetical protein